MQPSAGVLAVSSGGREIRSMDELEEGVTTVFEIGGLNVGVDCGGEAVALNTVECGGSEIDNRGSGRASETRQ